MKLLISVLAIFTFLPIIRGLGNTLPTTDVPDICEGESLTLTIADRITLQKGFIASPFLRCIRITCPSIEIAEGSFDDVPNLMHLDLAQNNIGPSNLFSFGHLPSVRILRLGDERYSDYAEETVVRYVYPYLDYLDLRNNKISSIRSLEDNPFPKLTHLDLSGNRIDRDTLNFLPNTLVYLDLSDNRLSRLSLNYMRNLLSLRLDRNDIEKIDDRGVSFTGLEKLVNLSITNNRISRIKEQEFKSMPNLRYLNLTDNQLSSTDLNVIAYSPSLETLILDSNSFENVPLTTSANITTLSLNRNRIRRLTASSFFGLPHLKRLHLSGNGMESVYVYTFENQKLLEELHLDGNLLSHLPADWCQNMVNLRYLNLAGNKFTSLESVIYSPTLAVTALHLEGNPIAYIKSSTAKLIPENMTVYLNDDFQSTETPISSTPPHPTTDGYPWPPTTAPSWMSRKYPRGE